MKKIYSLAAVAVLVCFSTMVFAIDTASPLTNAAAAAKASATNEAIKAVSGEIIIGKIQKIDSKANTILINNQTVNVKADELKNLTEGEKVKVNLATGTMNAEKIITLDKEKAKKATKEKVRKTKEQAVQKATDKAIEKLNQQ